MSHAGFIICFRFSKSKLKLKHFRKRESLSNSDNEYISELEYSEEDSDLEIRYSLSGENKALAIALYHVWSGAILFNDHQEALRTVQLFRLIFDEELKGLF